MHPNTKHGMFGTRIYEIWASMKKRCRNKNASNYERYGGRGISVCEEWMDFRNFYRDMASGYSNKLSLDRIDNNGNYCKKNCRWATPKEQANNSRGKRTKFILNDIETDYYKLSKKYRINVNTLSSRVHRGIPIEDAIRIPLQKHSGIGKRYRYKKLRKTYEV